MADVFEWGAIRVFLGSGVIEYLVPVGKVCIRVDLCQTFIGRNDKIIWNDNRVGFCVCKPDRQIFELRMSSSEINASARASQTGYAAA